MAFALLCLMCMVEVVDVVLSVAFKQFSERLDTSMAHKRAKLKVQNEREEDVAKSKVCRRYVHTKYNALTAKYLRVLYMSMLRHSTRWKLLVIM